MLHDTTKVGPGRSSGTHVTVSYPGGGHLIMLDVAPGSSRPVTAIHNGALM